MVGFCGFKSFKDLNNYYEIIPSLSKYVIAYRQGGGHKIEWFCIYLPCLMNLISTFFSKK